MASDHRNWVPRRTFLAGTALTGVVFGQVPPSSGAVAGVHRTYDVSRFGARGNRSSNDAGAFQAAIDACHVAGGGTVYVPPGNYLCGSLFLKSRVSLYLDAGATIYASTERREYKD